MTWRNSYCVSFHTQYYKRKLKDERLQLSEKRYHRIFERSTNSIFIVTLQGRFLDMNEAAIHLFEFENRE